MKNPPSKVLPMRTKEAKFLIVEDNPADLNISRNLLLKADGGANIHVLTSIPPAVSFLEDVKSGAIAAPRLVILDLDFGNESGFEFLRMWRSLELKNMPVIVWTKVEETLVKVSGMFGVSAVVSKDDGPQALDQAIARVLSASAPSEAGATGR